MTKSSRANNDLIPIEWLHSSLILCWCKERKRLVHHQVSDFQIGLSDLLSTSEDYFWVVWYSLNDNYNDLVSSVQYLVFSCSFSFNVFTWANSLWQSIEAANVTKQQTLIFHKVAQNHHGKNISYFQGHHVIVNRD